VDDPSNIDRAALQRLFRAIGEDIDDMRDLFGSFVDDTAPLFDAMRASSSAADWPALKRAAHTAKGSGRDFGAIELAEICGQLELDAAAGVVSDADERIARAEQAFATACDTLISLLDSGQME